MGHSLKAWHENGNNWDMVGAYFGHVRGIIGVNFSLVIQLKSRLNPGQICNPGRDRAGTKSRPGSRSCSAADIRQLDDDGSCLNMLLDDADKGMVIPVVVLTLNQKAVVASAFHSTK